MKRTKRKTRKAKAIIRKMTKRNINPGEEVIPAETVKKSYLDYFKKIGYAI